MRQIAGQMSLFDLQQPEQKKKPCEYSFQRYIGQRVYNWRFNHYGRIYEIMGYYTLYIVEQGRSGKNYRQYGTPYELRPAREDE